MPYCMITYEPGIYLMYLVPGTRYYPCKTCGKTDTGATIPLGKKEQEEGDNTETWRVIRCAQNTKQGKSAFLIGIINTMPAVIGRNQTARGDCWCMNKTVATSRVARQSAEQAGTTQAAPGSQQVQPEPCSTEAQPGIIVSHIIRTIRYHMSKTRY